VSAGDTTALKTEFGIMHWNTEAKGMGMMVI